MFKVGVGEIIRRTLTLSNEAEIANFPINETVLCTELTVPHYEPLKEHHVPRFLVRCYNLKAQI